MNEEARVADLRRRFPDGPKPKPPIPYAVQYYAAIVVFVTLALIGAIQIAGPDDLGLSPIVFRWIGVVGAVLGVLAGVLPKIQSPPDGRP